MLEKKIYFKNYTSEFIQINNKDAQHWKIESMEIWKIGSGKISGKLEVKMKLVLPYDLEGIGANKIKNKMKNKMGQMWKPTNVYNAIKNTIVGWPQNFQAEWQ